MTVSTPTDSMTAEAASQAVDSVRTAIDSIGVARAVANVEQSVLMLVFALVCFATVLGLVVYDMIQRHRGQTVVTIMRRKSRGRPV